MAEYIEREAVSAGICDHKNKIKTHFAKIIVNSIGKPCYNILYFDPADRIYHIGFGSYELSYVRKWLAEEFEVYNVPAADVASVRPELRKAVDLLHKNYEKALNSSYVRNPIAWALYHTWREVDENNSGNAIN